MVPSPTSFAVLTLVAPGNTIYQECDSGVPEGTTKAWLCQSAGYSSYVQRGPSSGGESEHPAPGPEVSARVPPASVPDRKLTDGSPTPSPDTSESTYSTWWDTLDRLWNHPPLGGVPNRSTRTWEAEHECRAFDGSHAFPAVCGAYR